MELNSAYSKHKHCKLCLNPVPTEQVSGKKKYLALILQTLMCLELLGTDSKYQEHLEVLPIVQMLTWSFPDAALPNLEVIIIYPILSSYIL